MIMMLVHAGRMGAVVVNNGVVVIRHSLGVVYLSLFFCTLCYSLQTSLLMGIKQTNEECNEKAN